MRLLLDTQALIWWNEGSRKLGRRTRAAIGREASGVLVSAATAWEMAIKSVTGRLTIREPVDRWMAAVLQNSGFDALDVTMAHALAVAELPAHHADPFDRLLIAQAQLDDLTIVTSDSAFEDYDVRAFDARE